MMRVSKGPLKLSVFTSLVGLVLLSLLSSPLTAAHAADQITSESQSKLESTALSDLRSCLSKEKSVLDVYYLIDNSRSMEVIADKTGTDPEGLRFQAVESSLKPFMELAKQGTEVYIAGGLFSRGAQTLVPWTQVDPDNSAATDGVGEALKQDVGGGTNWVEGLRLAQSELLQQKNQPGVRCQALVWITDGGIDIKQDPLATAAGLIALCGVKPTDIGVAAASSGLMFSLRQSEIIVFGVLIQEPPERGDDPEEGTNPKRESKVSYFNPVVVGTGIVDASYFNNGEPLTGPFNCGEQVSGAQGFAFEIQKPEQLGSLFQDLVICITDSCTWLPPTDVNCDGKTCEISVPKGIASMQLRVPSGFQPSNVSAPNGSGACLTGGCSTREEIAETGIIRILVNNQGGTWSIKTETKTPDPLLFSGLKIISDALEVNPREPEITSGIRLGQGKAVTFDSTNYEQLLFEGRVEFPNGETEPAQVSRDGDSWVLEWSPTPDSPTGLSPKEAIVSLAATAAGVGTEVPSLRLAKIEKRFPIRKKNLNNDPTLIQPLDGEVLIFTPIEGNQGVGKAEIVVRGPENNDGKVCWNSDPDALVGKYTDTQSSVERQPKASIDVTPEVGLECPGANLGVTLPRGVEVRIPIVMTVSPQAEGYLAGTIYLDFFGPTGEEGFPQYIEFSTETTVIKSWVAFWIVFVFLTLLGIGIPYLALVIFARRQAAFSSKLDGTRWASLSAVVGPDGLLKVDELDPSRYEFIFLNKSGITCKIEMGVDVHEVVPPTWWPFKPLHTVVKTPSGTSIFTNHDQIIAAGQNVGTSSQALGNVFYFVVDPIDSVIAAADVTVDDWGNPVSTAAELGGTVATAPIDGRLVVLASGDANPTDAISKSMAKVRTWSGWVDVFTALSSGRTVPNSRVKLKRSNKTAEQITNQPPITVDPRTGFEGVFNDGEATLDNTVTEKKKSIFGRKEKKSKGGSPDQQPPSDFNSTDW